MLIKLFLVVNLTLERITKILWPLRQIVYLSLISIQESQGGRLQVGLHLLVDQIALDLLVYLLWFWGLVRFLIRLGRLLLDYIYDRSWFLAAFVKDHED
jgi:hypothetical protein